MGTELTQATLASLPPGGDAVMAQFQDTTYDRQATIRRYGISASWRQSSRSTRATEFRRVGRADTRSGHRRSQSKVLAELVELVPE